MLTLLSGPPGLDTLLVARAIERAHRPSVWIAYDGVPEGQAPAVVTTEPPYEALAALAQRLAHPQAPKEALTIADLMLLRGAPAERAVRSGDFGGTAELLTLAGMAAKGQPLPGLLVVHTLSRLYERVVTQVLSSAAHLWGERGLQTAHSVASNAVAHLTYDLSRAQMPVLITSWETETTLKGKVTGMAPAVPKATMGHVSLWLRLDEKNRLKVAACDPLIYGEQKGATLDEFDGNLIALKQEEIAA